jgi:hypothetical protein
MKGAWLRRLSALLAVFTILSAPAAAQGGATATIRGVLVPRPDSLVVSLLTMGPGEMLFDRFGHTAIRVRNVATGLDSAWNWGMYDFDSPGFIRRFLTGDTQYWMAGYPAEFFIDAYRRQGRAVWEQELELDQAAADSLLRLMRWNARPENRFYRYDYYLDNCSTRARDALDVALRGALKASLTGPGQGFTWREETLRLSSAFPVIAFGMTVALGRRADATVAAWDEAFIPIRLHDLVRAARVPTFAGPRPLVRAERVLVSEGAFRDAAAPPSYARPAGLAGLALAWVIVIVGRGARTFRAARVAAAAIGSAWHLVVGIAGLLVLLAGLATRHTFMGANATVLLGTPASLVLAVWYARAWRTGAAATTARVANALGAFTAVCSVVALVAHVVPGLSPADWAPALFAAPVHVAATLALRVHVGAARARSAAAPVA